MKGKFVNLLGTQKICLLRRFKLHDVCISAITDKEEELIDSNKDAISTRIIKLKSGAKLDCKRIILYGDINFNSKDDINYLKTKENSLLDTDNWKNIVDANFSYKDGGYYEMIKPATPSNPAESVHGWYDTYNVITWLKYNHCILGKPKKIVIYEH